MSTSIQSASVIGNAGTIDSLSIENRRKLADLAAEFESMLLSQMLRDMNESGRWDGLGKSGLDTLGAETFDQTFQMELSRYLANSGGLGLSQQLMKALDAMNATTTTAASRPATTSFVLPPAAAPVRTGWNGLNMQLPAYGGSGAQWGGFNTDRAMAGDREHSVKDAFYRWTYGLEFNPAGKGKAGIEQFLKSNLDSAREYGLNILDVKGECILVETKENGPEWIDVVQAAASTNPADTKWQWLPVDGAPAGGGTLGAALAEIRGLPRGQEIARAVLADGRLSGDALLKAFQTEISAVRSGAASPALQRTAQATASTDLSLPGTKVTSAFGWRNDPFTGEAKFHKGVDLRAAEGSDVASAGAGRVVFSGTNGAYGTSIVVQHANGLSTRYAHLAEALVRAGDEVADGQVIGLAGQTGRATAPHLHFEVLEDGVPVDPLR